MLLLLLGPILLAHPVYTDLHLGETRYYPNFERADEPVADEPTIAYENLPAEAQQAFDQDDKELPDLQFVLWSGEDENAVETLRSHRYVTHEGTHYRINLIHKDGAFPHTETAVGVLLYAAGGLAALFGVALGVQAIRGRDSTV
jgi:hypothetical protein